MLLAGVVGTTDWLQAGVQYTFTFISGRFFEYRSDDWIFTNLRDRMNSWAEVIKVDRPLFSDHIIVSMTPKWQQQMADMLSAFDYAWRDMGYNSYKFLTAESGAISSQPGGLTEISTGITETLESTIAPVITGSLKPIYPYLLGAIAVYAAITMLPMLASKRR